MMKFFIARIVWVSTFVATAFWGSAVFHILLHRHVNPLLITTILIAEVAPSFYLSGLFLMKATRVRRQNQWIQPTSVR